VPPERLQKILAAAGVASRRAAEEMIAAGRVTVDGRVAVLGDRADPATDAIAVDGRPVGAPEALRHIVLNKPAGVMSTVHDRHAARTVVDLVPPGLARGVRLYPVGRLDGDSEGVVLLTNDGDWAQRVLHPRHAVEREYAVGVDRPLTPSAISALLGGIELEEGTARAVAVRTATAAETRRLLETLDGTTRAYRELAWYRVTLGQGWKRQVRRMFGVVGEPVRRLVRVRFGTVRLGDLGPGEARSLSAEEVARIDRVAGAEVRRPGSTMHPDRPGKTPSGTPRYADRRDRRDAGRPGGGR
jgi:23S rRNA pseudouridine2605 synthase